MRGASVPEEDSDGCGPGMGRLQRELSSIGTARTGGAACSNSDPWFTYDKAETKRAIVFMGRNRRAGASRKEMKPYLR